MKFVDDIIKYAMNNNSIEASYYDKEFGDKPLVQYIIPHYDVRDGECYLIRIMYNGGEEIEFTDESEPVKTQYNDIINWLDGK